MSMPYEPSEDEKSLYYNGFPSMPFLIARSSTFTWVMPPLNSHDRSYRRRGLHTVGFHPLIEPWNTMPGPDSVRFQTIQALRASKVRWNTIDIFRVGDPLDECPVTMLVSVSNKSLSWTHGLEMAMACRAVLEQHGFLDVHCEVLCANRYDSVATETPRLVSKLEPDLDLDIMKPLTDFLGNGIASAMTPIKLGTTCLYLQVERVPQFTESAETHTDAASTNSSDVVVLTCRHVVVPVQEKAELDFVVESGDQHRVHQLLPHVLDPCLARCRRYIRMYQKEISLLKENRDRKLALDTLDASQENAIMAKIAKYHQAIEWYHMAENRLDSAFRSCTGANLYTGRLLYARRFEPTRPPNWMPDWALLKLNPEAFETPLPKLINQVHFGIDLAAIRRAAGAFGSICIDDETAMIRLEGIIPVDELTRPTTEDETSSIFVIKRGLTSGVSWGRGNEVLSVHQHYTDEDLDFQTLAWCVVGRSYYAFSSFSVPGDSGSCVFDIWGRVAGMVTGGLGAKQDIQDVTYVAPMELIFEDMKAAGFVVTIL